MSTVYRVKLPFTGEIKESNNLKRLYQIAITDLRDYVGARGFEGFKNHCIAIEKVIYNCSDDCEDYWNYPETDSTLLLFIYVSKLSISIMRVSDSRECYISRV